METETEADDSATITLTKHTTNPNNSTKETDEVSNRAVEAQQRSTEKASTSSSPTQSVVSDKNSVHYKEGSKSKGVRCRTNTNNNGCAAASYSSPVDHCTRHRLPTELPKETEDYPGVKPQSLRSNNSSPDMDNLDEHHNSTKQQTKNTELNHSRKNTGEKNNSNNTVTAGNCYKNSNNNNNNNGSSSKSSSHRHYKTSSHHHRHSSHYSEHKQHSTLQNQRRHLHHHHHHHHSRHKSQRNSAQTSSDSTSPSTLSRSRQNRHNHSDEEESLTSCNRNINPDALQNLNKDMAFNQLLGKEFWLSNPALALTPVFSERTSKLQPNCHRPMKKSSYSSLPLESSQATLSTPRNPVSPDDRPLAKKPRLPTSLLEMTDIDRKTSEGSEAHIHCLFPELLVMIFCYLDVRDKGRAAQVCVRWRDAAYTRTVWRGVEAKIHLRRSNPSLFRSLAKRGIRRIQILSLKRSLRDVVSGIPDLESLNLSGCYNITDAGLGQALLHRLLTVHELNLSLCKQITDYSLSRIALYLKNLRVLHLGGCSVITNAGLFVISYGLVKLISLDLRSCRDLSDQGIAHLAGLGDNTHQGNLALEHLCLQDCQKLTDQALRYISIGLKNLMKVNLSFCSGVTDAGLQYLAKMPSLRKINLASCDQVTDAGLAHLARGGSRITSLDVSFCDKIGDWGLSCLAGGLFNLECLSLSACNISDNGISHIVQTMHGLTTLNIGQCNRITDRGLNLIADNLKKLSRMDLYGCTKISAKGLERIMQLPSLSSLNLGLWHKR